MHKSESCSDGELDTMPATASDPSIEPVAIVAEDVLVRAGLSAYFLSEPGWEVIALGLPGVLPQDWIPGGSSDLLVWDGGGDGESLEIVRDLLPGLPPRTIVLIASSEDAEIASTAGARAVLHRQVEPEVLLAAARAVLAGLWVSTSRSTDHPSPSPTLRKRSSSHSRRVSCRCFG